MVFFLLCTDRKDVGRNKLCKNFNKLNTCICIQNNIRDSTNICVLYIHKHTHTRDKVTLDTYPKKKKVRMDNNAIVDRLRGRVTAWDFKKEGFEDACIKHLLKQD